MNRKIFVLFLTFLAILAAFSSCVRQVSKATELRFGFTTEPTTLDPLNPNNSADGRSILFNIYEGLVKPSTDGTFLPCIAESWTIEEDGLVYIFKIRDKVYFHNGEVVEIADVVYSLRTAIAAGFDGMDNIDRVAPVGENNVKVTLKSADPDFLPYMTAGIVKRGNIDREKDINGTGPYFLESYALQRNLVLKKFDNYRQPELPHLEKITVIFYANYDALMVALRGGGIDGAQITGAMSAQLDHREFDIINSYSAAVQLLALNNASAPLNDVRVRQALNYGIDIQNIIDTAFFGIGIPSGSPIIPGLSAYYEDSLSYPYDPEKAKKLLDEAGYNKEQPLYLEIKVPSNYTMHVDTAQVILNQLEKIGVAANIKLVDWNTWINDVYLGRQYQTTIISLDSSVASPRNFLSRYRSGSGGNFFNFSSAEFDGIYDAILTEMDDAKRNRLYRDAQRAVTENAANVFIQDILYLKAFIGGVYAGVLNYPLYVVDFASIYGIEKR